MDGDQARLWLRKNGIDNFLHPFPFLVYSERSSRAEGHFFEEKRGNKWDIEEMRQWSERCLTGEMTPVNYLKEAEDNYDNLREELRRRQNKIRKSKEMAEI